MAGVSHLFRLLCHLKVHKMFIINLLIRCVLFIPISAAAKIIPMDPLVWTNYNLINYVYENWKVSFSN